MNHNVGLTRPILNNEVNFPICLAPMVGLTHVAFRLLVREYLPQGARTIWPTEMLNSRRLPNENLMTTPETLRSAIETQLVPQILGNEESYIRDSVRRLEEWGASGIDINMGCPVRKALQHNYGVALMGDANYARDVVAMTVRNTKLPVSVKLRAGPQGDKQFLFDFVRGLEEEGAAWLCLHPRTAEQKRRGRADWSQISEVRAKISIGLIGNGDVQTAEDAQRMLLETGADMVMVGRALTARPWLLWQLGEQWGWPAPSGREGEFAPRSPEEEGREFGRALLRLVDFMEQYFQEPLGLRKLKFFVRTSGCWLMFGQQLYSLVSLAQTYEQARENISRFFSQPQAMCSQTELRQ